MEENQEPQTQISMVWIRVLNVEPEIDWIRVPSSEVGDIHDLKRVIKKQLPPALNDCSIGHLSVKTTLDLGPKQQVMLVSVEKALLSTSDFLKLHPPSLSYMNRVKNTRATRLHVDYARLPESITTWEGFKDEVNGAIWDDTPKYVHPIFPKHGTMACEEDVRDALNHNVLLPLNILLESDEADEKFARCFYLGNILGEPDFIQCSNQKLRLAIEVKTKWALSASDLVETYIKNLIDLGKKTTTKPKPSVYFQLSQIFGYLSHNELRYGVLTTYENTWFLYRENPSHLRISPPIQHDDLQPTLLQCLFYLVSLARNNHQCASAPPSHHGDDGDSSDDDDDCKSKQRVQVL